MARDHMSARETCGLRTCRSPVSRPNVVGMTSTDSSRRVLVTGAASGIGLACAARFAGAGDEVTVLDKDADQVERVANDLGAKALVCDLLDIDRVAAIDLDVDIVINNAGFQHVAPIESFPHQKFAQILALMLQAPFVLAQSVLPHMYDRGFGRFVHISSVHGHRASAFKAGYVTAKHGLEGLSKAIAIEGAAHGVTSNTIAPGFVRTPLVENQIADQAQAHGIQPDQVVSDVLLARTPVKRLLEPDEVARLAQFMCGPGSDSITGASYDMTGGWTAA